uniref:Uncharacterized protein n=1 Tax=viral metagenome TaxID=1070528 RepID=A0A6C0BLY2_9ZZZZ
MFSIDTLPSEIGFKISEFGQAPPELDLNLMTSQILRHNPNFNMRSQLNLTRLLTLTRDIHEDIIALRKYLELSPADVVRDGSIAPYLSFNDVVRDGETRCEIRATVTVTGAKYIRPILKHIRFIGYSHDDSNRVLTFRLNPEFTTLQVSSIYNVLGMDLSSNWMYRTYSYNHVARECISHIMSSSQPDLGESVECLRQIIEIHPQFNVGELLKRCQSFPQCQEAFELGRRISHEGIYHCAVSFHGYMLTTLRYPGYGGACCVQHRDRFLSLFNASSNTDIEASISKNDRLVISAKQEIMRRMIWRIHEVVTVMMGCYITSL